MSDAERFRYPPWVRGDLDGFFGLMVDNLVQVLLIAALCAAPWGGGLPAEFVFGRILPGVAVSLLIGNVFYGLQAHWVARRRRNADCTALPYGINTPSVFAFALFVMGPTYQQAVAAGKDATAAAELAWLAGVAACLVSGLVEFGGAFFAERLRRATPRAALLGVLAAVGIAFIASDFAFQIYAKPLIGILPMAVLLLAYFARYRFPFGLPGGLIAIALGTLIAWGLTLSGAAAFGGSETLAARKVTAALGEIGWTPPTFYGQRIAELLTTPDLVLRFLTVSIPMGLINLLGALQNIESAEAGGDRFATAPSLAVNGVGSIAAGLFGSCFPTTIYIGHPGWKALGARAGYSILNGAFFTACFLFGLGPLLAAAAPIEAGAPIVMYIGILITAQAFQATPRSHAPAVAVSLFPALAALLVIKIDIYLRAAGAAQTFADLLSDPAQTPLLPGLLTLSGANSSWIIVTLVLTAVAAALIERQYRVAATWTAVATAMTALGLMHAYRLSGNAVRELFLWQTLGADEVGERAWPVAIGYALATLVFIAVAWGRRGPSGRLADAADNGAGDGEGAGDRRGAAASVTDVSPNRD